MDIIKAMESKKVFGGYFTGVTWDNWKRFLSLLYGLDRPLEAKIGRFTGKGGYTQGEGVEEAYAICGRRGGKTSIAALIAAYAAVFQDWSQFLSPGEKGHVFLLAVNMDQAKILKDRIEALLNLTPDLRKKIRKVTIDTIELRNGISIVIKPASFRGLRGYTLVLCILEELSFWRFEESAMPDVEVVRAVKPGLSTVPGSKLIGISSPFQKMGVLYNKFKNFWGRPGSPLIWKAATVDMNPQFSKQTIKTATVEDPISAATEYGAEFRADLSSYVDPEIVDDCIPSRRRELPPMAGVKYFGAVDSSGGRADSFTMSIVYKLESQIVLACLREKVPPFNPDDVMAEFSGVFQTYKIRKILADNYAPEFVAQGFRKNGITVENTMKGKSALYLELLAALNSGTIDLLDQKRLIHQIKSLDRKTRSGRDSIDNFHGHDDLSNVVALASSMIITKSKPEIRIR